VYFLILLNSMALQVRLVQHAARQARSVTPHRSSNALLPAQPPSRPPASDHARDGSGVPDQATDMVASPGLASGSGGGGSISGGGSSGGGSSGGGGSGSNGSGGGGSSGGSAARTAAGSGPSDGGFT